MCVCVCECVLGQHFFSDAYLIKQYRHPLSTYFLYITSTHRIDFISDSNWLINFHN